jgi:hypothetical protein
LPDADLPADLTSASGIPTTSHDDRTRTPGDLTCTDARPARSLVAALEPWYGIDIDDLDSGHSLSADPAVARFRETAAMLARTSGSP